MYINITDRIQNNNESIRLGLVELPVKTILTLTLSTNPKRPVTASYITITSDGETYSSGDKYYSYKQHKDGNYYINLNVGNGYKNVKVNVNDIIKEV